MPSEIITDSRGDLLYAESLAKAVLPLLEQYPVLLLKGDLGSGKTSFCKLLLRQAGVKEEVSSPTFNLVSEYPLSDGKKAFHFDLYRIKYPEELEEIGFFDYLDSDNPCLIEWPEIAEKRIRAPYLSLSLYHDNGLRHYVLMKHF